MPTSTWNIPADASQVPRIRSAVSSFATEHDVREPPLQDVRVALSEAVTNAVVHGYVGGRSGRVDVAVTVDWPNHEMEIVVTDDGTGMAPRLDSPGLGLGLPLIATLADGLVIDKPRRGPGTRLSIMFRLPVA